MKATDSWFNGICKDCKSNIVVCQSKEKDYFYYCSQKRCKNHEGVELYDDDEYPEFLMIEDKKEDEFKWIDLLKKP